MNEVQNEKFKILFVCEGNTCRSQMAEGYLKSLADDRLDIYSSGVNARSGKVNPNAITVMSELGIDITSQRPKKLSQLPKITFDLVIFLCKKPDSTKELKIPGLPLFFHWKTDDPYTCDCNGETDCSTDVIKTYREARDTLIGYCDQFIDRENLDTLINKKVQNTTILDSLDEGVIVHDENRIIYLINNAAEKITGYSRDEVLGMDCHSIFKDGGICGSNCSFCTEDCESSGVLHAKEYKIDFLTKTGTKKRLKMKVTPSKIGHSGQSAVTVILRNDTEISELRRKVKKKYDFHGMIGKSHKMREIFETISQISMSNYPVLITGESGTGKELTANAIHNESRRSEGPFVPINCGALPEHILESELFGHVRGAFTGAVRDKKGRFEIAHKGTLFLDEVGELTPAFQVKLLRVLQEKKFERVGGEKTISVDVRILAATNRDLKKMIADGDFREDLFYRLCVMPIHLPPLRERKEDIPQLIEQILANISEESGKEFENVSDDAIKQLMAHNWPGNIRQLINILQFASIRCPGSIVEFSHLPPEVTSTDEINLPDLAIRPTDLSKPMGRKQLTVESVKQAIENAGGNKLKAAKLLGVGRATLYRFIEKNPI